MQVLCEAVARRYGNRWALADVSLRVPSGSVAIIAGANGSGKSTLLKIIATAIRPHAGTVHIGEYDVRSAREDVRQSTALLTHDSYLYDSLTAQENLEIVARARGVEMTRVAEALERVGIASRAHDEVRTFSAGMRKRVSLARVLLQSPRVALLDEPYGALDPSGFDLMDACIRELRGSGTTVLMATHQIERGRNLGDSAVLLSGGRVKWSGPAADLPHGDVV